VFYLLSFLWLLFFSSLNLKGRRTDRRGQRKHNPKKTIKKHLRLKSYLLTESVAIV
jgi:hypothetical protein